MAETQPTLGVAAPKLPRNLESTPAPWTTWRHMCNEWMGRTSTICQRCWGWGAGVKWDGGVWRSSDWDVTITIVIIITTIIIYHNFVNNHYHNSFSAWRKVKKNTCLKPPHDWSWPAQPWFIINLQSCQTSKKQYCTFHTQNLDTWDTIRSKITGKKFCSSFFLSVLPILSTLWGGGGTFMGSQISHKKSRGLDMVNFGVCFGM